MTPHPSQSSAEYERPIPPRRLLGAAIFFGALALAVGLILLPALAFGQEAAPVVGDDPGEILQLAMQALGAAGPVRWVALALAGVLAAVAGVRWFARTQSGKVWTWIRSDEGGTVLGWVVSAAGAVVVYLVGGGTLSVAGVAGVALGLRAGTAITWSDGRRLLRAVLPVLSPLLARIPKVGPLLVSLLGAVSGATAKAEIAAATAAAYKPLEPAPDAQAAAAALSQPPVS